jgi:hypothetical protein
MCSFVSRYGPSVMSTSRLRCTRSDFAVRGWVWRLLRRTTYTTYTNGSPAKTSFGRRRAKRQVYLVPG